MGKSLIGIIFLALVVIFCACSEKGSVEEEKESSEVFGPRTIRIVFNFPGDDIGEPEHRDILQEIIASIRNRNAGEIVSFGFGMGTMEVTIRIGGDEALEEIRRIITEIYPKADYRLTKPHPSIS